MMEFPKQIVVRKEIPGPGEEPFMIVLEAGVEDTSIDETTACAVYERVDVGRIEVERRFVSKAALRARRKAR